MHSDATHIVAAMAALIWTGDADGAVAFVNRPFRDYAGMTPEDARGDGWLAVLHPDDAATARRCWMDGIAAGEANACEVRVRRADDRYRWFLVRVTALRDAAGGVVGRCGVATDIDDRRQAEDMARAEGGHFRSIVEGIPALVTLMTPDGRLSFANRQVERYFGATRDALMALEPGATIHRDDRAAVLAAWHRSVATGEPFDIEARRPRCDGVVRWFHLRGLPLRDADGRIVFWYLLHTDIDDRKRSERLLSGEKLLLERVASSQPLAEVLDALCRLFEETVDDARCDVVPIDASGDVSHLVSDGGTGAGSAATDVQSGPAGIATTLDRPLIVDDLAADPRWAGQPWREAALRDRWRACWAIPIVARSRKALGALVAFGRAPGGPTPFQNDLLMRLANLASIAIERADADAERARNAAFLVRAQELSRTGSYWWRVATDEIGWSDELYRIYAFERGTPITHPLIFTRFFPEEVHLLQAVIARANGAGRDFAYEHRLRMPDGTTKHVQVVAHGACVDGRLEFIGAVQDITERRRADEALARMRSELAHVARVTSLGALAASIAHEVNQPLSGIVTNAGTCLRMLAADPPNVEGARETARRTIRDGNRAADVVVRLRALFTKQEVAMQSLDLGEATAEVLALMRTELQRAGIVLRPDFRRPLPQVDGDRVQLQQVILNLLLNAIDAMATVDGPRTLSVGTDLDADVSSVVVAVADVGVGLDGTATDRLFEPFHTTKPTGMGIGLSVSRTIVERHRGRLWAVANDGPGATFRFSIPCVGNAFGTEAQATTTTVDASSPNRADRR